MPGQMERAPRRRPSRKDKDTSARRAPERERVPERRTSRAPERERAPRRAAESKPRARTAERDTARASERQPRRAVESKPRRRAAEPKAERTPRARTAQRDTARTVERTARGNSAERPTRKRSAEAKPRARATERKTARTARKPAPRTVARRPSPARKRPLRRKRTSPGGFGAFLSRAAIVILLLLALGRLGDRLVFQELQVVHPDQTTAEETVSTKTLVSDHVNAASDFFAAAPDRAAQWNRKDGFYTILLAGVDDHNGGSDTVILLSVDSKQHQIFGVSVPRDTKAIINGKGYKMNAAYKIGGMPLLASTISEQMSIPVDYTVEIDLAGFAAVIDAIGGVDFDVPLDMDYEDPKQNLEIHVSKGLQHLDGETALKVVRFRHNSDGTGYGDEDLGRIRTQQNFLKAAAKRMASLNILTKLDDMAKIFQQYVKTDLTLPNLAWLGKEAFYAGADGIQFATLPGTWRSPYIHTDAEKALTLINEHLNPYQDDRTLDDLKFPA